MNSLATRTRADLSYFASVIASSSTRFTGWSFQLWNKVLRYLQATAKDGLMYRLGGGESELTCWSDAGYGGEGTRAQSGVLIAWGGGTTVWRSIRQRASALSTCEAEVAAPALALQVVEGLRCLLTEWCVNIASPSAPHRPEFGLERV